MHLYIGDNSGLAFSIALILHSRKVGWRNKEQVWVYSRVDVLLFWKKDLSVSEVESLN